MAHQNFFRSSTRGRRVQDRVKIHIALTPEERKKLIDLTHRMKSTASEVVRFLINMAAA